MDFKVIGNYIEKFAPLLGEAIATANPLAGALISIVSSAFGIDPKSNDTDSLINKISSNQEAQIKLKEIENQHAELLASYQLDDKMDARKREEIVTEVTGKRDFILEWISYIVIFGYFVMCALIVFNKVDNENNQVLYMMFGQLTSGFIMVLSYFFGSSNKKD